MIKEIIKERRIPFVGLGFVFLFFITGCAKEVRKPVSVLDTPEHHYVNGMKLLDRQEFNKAYQSFTKAKELDPEFAPAFVGFALIEAHKKNYPKAYGHLAEAWENADVDEHKVLVQVGYVRILSEERADEDWIEDAEDHFEKGKDYDEKSPELHYYMGIAYKRAYNFDRASDMFREVLELNSELMVEADYEWSLVQKIQRAAPGSKIGNQIALIDKIDRADIAALFIQELKLDKLYNKRGGKTFDISYKGPAGTELKVKRLVDVQDETDIKNHVLAADVAEAIRLNIRGLQPFPDHTFRPDQPISRAEYAVMLEDIMIKVSGDEKQATKFVGSTSPFPDVRNDFWAFNAILFTTTKGIMEAKDLSTGEFRAQDPVSGADALLIIRKIKDELKLL
jgi:tetratricopeptide (TPR) repeat protein